jgi:hypothetical protein
MKRWLNVKDFEEEFGVSSSTQAKWRSSGILPYSKLGGFVFYDRNLIDKAFENHCVSGVGE